MPIFRHWIAALAAGACLVAAGAWAEPAILYDVGGKFDKSFNEAAFYGMEKWKKESGKKYLELEVHKESQREQAVRSLAEKGASPIIVVGFEQAAAVDKVSKEFPKLHFAIVDMVVEGPNVQSVVFKEHEGSFLVGALAAMASKTGKVGFIGGMDIPLIHRFGCGYEQGVRFVRPDAEVFSNMTGSTGAAWHDPARGAELALKQFARGADVVFAAAGGTGVGVYQAAKEHGKLAIGVDINQNYLQPGAMLTSMLKRVDVAVYNVTKDFTPGMLVLGLREGGVDYAVDENNARLLTPEMRKRVEGIKADIIRGKISVADYMADNACRY